MSYNRTFWENGITPINADNLNNLEEGVFANAEALSSVNENMSALSEEVGTKAEQTDLETVNNRVTETQGNVEEVANNVEALGTRVTALELSGGGGGGELPTGLLTVSDIKPNLEGNETDKIPSVSAVKTAIEVAKEEILEDIPSGGASTIRYNEETDVVEVLFGGEWVAWEKANMLWDGHIFDNGNVFEDFTGGYKLLNSALNYHKLTIGTELEFERTGGYGSTTPGEATVSTVNKINVTDFTKMRVTGMIYSTSTNAQGYTCTLGLSSVQGKANVCSFDAKATGDNNPGTSFDEVIDISSCNSEYYFTMYNTTNMALGGVKISSIQFYD